MHHVIRLLQYILYNLILNQIVSGRWGPATGTLLLVPPNANFMPANFAAPPPILENENCVASQCPEFYAEDALMFSQVIYLGLIWLGLIVLLNPGVTIGNFTKKYLKPRWWLIINSMWIWVIIPHHLETASYYPVISVKAGPSTSTIQECVLSPASSSMALFAHHAQSAANPDCVSTLASRISQVSHGVTQRTQNTEKTNQMTLFSMLMSLGKIATTMSFAKSTVATALQSHVKCGPSPKKTLTGACTSTDGEKAHPLTLTIMKRDPWMPLVQACL
ncbi:hypothetical protein DSO57_1026858 [Entomophthora muscae]|uniref:Uncharacterized protein n=1 Tax=Entomophthora muscae TaxID=34485 RepID=A0ACC2SES5_9FUNG|nr:hypothetical protein DSO57_1026858 [Entomophthora muscae]